MTTGEKLSMLRKGNNITQEQLAQLLGVTRQSVSRWEMDLAFPETEKLIRLSKLFSCSIDFLLSEAVRGEQQEDTGITPETCVSFIHECGYFFLATAVNARPRLRPFGMICADGKELLIVTDSRKSVNSDLEQNRNVELSTYNPSTGKWLRISGTAEKEERPVSRELILSAYPSLRQKYPEGQEMFLQIYRIHMEQTNIL